MVVFLLDITFYVLKTLFKFLNTILKSLLRTALKNKVFFFSIEKVINSFLDKASILSFL
jgi:hypothetical protein